MSPEVALLIETWDIVKTMIPKKEQLPIAESLVRSFEEHVGIEDVEEHLNEFDRTMRAAIKTHFDFADDGDEEE